MTLVLKEFNPPEPNITPDNFVLPDGDQRTQIAFISSKVEESLYPWRCCQCMSMQPPQSLQVWMADGIMPKDPPWAVKYKNEKTKWNGNHSAWCMGCAVALLPIKPLLSQITAAPVKASSDPSTNNNTRPDTFWRGFALGIAIAVAIVILIKTFL